MLLARQKGHAKWIVCVTRLSYDCRARRSRCSACTPLSTLPSCLPARVRASPRRAATPESVHDAGTNRHREENCYAFRLLAPDTWLEIVAPAASEQISLSFGLGVSLLEYSFGVASFFFREARLFANILSFVFIRALEISGEVYYSCVCGITWSKSKNVILVREYNLNLLRWQLVCGP